MARSSEDVSTAAAEYGAKRANGLHENGILRSKACEMARELLEKTTLDVKSLALKAIEEKGGPANKDMSVNELLTRSTFVNQVMEATLTIPGLFEEVEATGERGKRVFAEEVLNQASGRF